MGKYYVFTACLLLGVCNDAMAQGLPEDEIQVNLSKYFDSFEVAVLYPSIAVTHKISESTSITGRYLVDMVSAASMRRASTPAAQSGANISGETENEHEDGGFDAVKGLWNSLRKVDAVTGASRRTPPSGGGGTDFEEYTPLFDDMRHELGLGVSRLVAGRLLSLNGLYSKENDYRSATLAGTFTHGFAEKNTVLQLGAVHSRDQVFPVTKDWRRDRNVTSFSANLSQILSTRLVMQLLTSYTEDRGYLADAYQLISIEQGDSIARFDPAHPASRRQQAVAGRFKFRLNERSSMQLGYRYYRDSWDLKSHTISADYQKYISPRVILSLGLRTYLQGRAFFFKPVYTQLEQFMTADIKLDKGFSNELQLGFTFFGGRSRMGTAQFGGHRIQLNVGLSIYQRHSASPYWFNNSKNLLSANVTGGIRIGL